MRCSKGNNGCTLPSPSWLPNGPSNPDLSPRQLEVLDLVTKGLTNQEIAETLGFTKDGTKRHLHHIYQKLGVSSRAEATSEALKRGLL